MRVLITGGAGYIGSVLSPRLLKAGHDVTVYDILLFGEKPLANESANPKLNVIKGDIRDRESVARVIGEGKFDAVIHLAAISNDPSSELEPSVTRGVNGVAVEAIIKDAKKAGVRRFLYASSASVYGVREEEDVTEALDLTPITLYAQCKAEGEGVLNSEVSSDFVGVSVRAATVCGYSPRLRLDLTVNLLTHQALVDGRLRVFGGSQMRPNIHVDDLASFYEQLLTMDAQKINGQAFNVSYENATVMNIARLIREEVDPKMEIDVVPTNDNRSYHLSAARAKRDLGFEAKTPLRFAVTQLRDAYAAGKVPEPAGPWYRNVAWMNLHPGLWKA